ncbi:MAG: apolipoprotein N-acyltransferase [Desulfobacteraceae bacterium]|nr:apolipoprotein N-acyltransferase [Desulfobacteraceae bacterium]
MSCDNRELIKLKIIMINTLNYKSLIGAFLSGIMLTCSFPETGFDKMAWIALLPLFISTLNLSTKESFFAGLITGIVHYFTLLYWLLPFLQKFAYLHVIPAVSVLLLLSAYLAFYIAIFSLISNRVPSSPFSFLIIMPALWVSCEYLRTFLFSGFPWELLGYSQYARIYLIQISDITGTYGISFLVVLANAVFFQIFLFISKNEWHGRRVNALQLISSVILVGLFFSIITFYGNKRLKYIDIQAYNSEKINIAIVQGNIDQTKKWDPEFQYATTKKIIDLSLSAKDKRPDLVVWPETAATFYFLYNQAMTGMVMNGIIKSGADFLIGSPSFKTNNEQVKYYNSAFLVSKKGELLDKYDKVHLIPFGEYVPLKKLLWFIENIVEGSGDFSQGKTIDTLKWGDYKLGIQICGEIIFPNLSRTMRNKKAGLLINITNDAWYGKTGAPYQHFSMAVLRAVENRRSLIRSANTGISAFVDPAGRVFDRTPLYKEAVVTRSMPVLKTETFYTKYGDLFALTCLCVAIAFIFSGYIMGRTSNRKYYY